MVFEWEISNNWAQDGVLRLSELLESTAMYNQRLNYLHWNPVVIGFVNEPLHWLYSSTVDYFTERKGLLQIDILDDF